MFFTYIVVEASNLCMRNSLRHFQNPLQFLLFASGTAHEPVSHVFLLCKKSSTNSL